MAFCRFCGHDNGENRFCTRCGAGQWNETPAAAVAPAPAPSGVSTRTLLLGVLGVGTLVVMTGLAAALVVLGRAADDAPRVAITETDIAQVASSEAWPTLRQIHTLQRRHHAEHGRFTRNLDDRTASDVLAGYAGEPEEGFFRFWVPVAGTRDLCIEARPTVRGERAGLSISSMDEEGKHYLGAACMGVVMTHEPTDENGAMFVAREE